MGVTFVTGLIAVLLLFSGAASGQVDGFAIVGQAVVVGPNSERFGAAGAQVRLQSVSEVDPDSESQQAEAPAAEPTAETDELGIFRFSGIPAGCYVTVATAPGMIGQSDLFCLPAEEQPFRLAIEMQVEAVVESVEVTASAITIDPSETSSSGSVGFSTIDNAPKANRRYEDVMPLIPGVLRGNEGEINLNGVRASQSGSQLNSVDMTDPVSRTSQFSMPLSVISNVQVLSTPYNAKFGGFAGAVSTVETKPANLSKLTFDLQNFGPRIRRRDGAIMGIESFTPRLTVNVPIKDGRLALLHSTEYQFVRADQEDANLPLLERDVERETLTVFNQFDARISNRNRMSLSILVYPEKLSYFGLNAFNTQLSTPDLRRRGQMVTLRDTHEFQSGALLISSLSNQDLDNDVKPRTYDPSFIDLERARGAFFNRQARRTIRRNLSEQYHFAPLGNHQIVTGIQWGLESYSGDQIFNPITWLGINNRVVSELDFTNPTTVRANKNDLATFVQDKWSVSEALTLDLGVRLERDSIAREWNPSYRAGFAYAFGGGSRTVLRGGSGLFIDRVSLLVPTFMQLPVRIETRFDPSGDITSLRRFDPRIDGKIRNARSLGWNLQLDHELINDLFLRVGYQQRRTTRNFLIEPSIPVGSSGEASALILSNNGRDHYREYQVTARYRLKGTGHITASYVRSSSVGDLNDLGSIYGPTPLALIRPNERGPLRFDVPHRFLAWTEFPLPFGLKAIPVWEVRSGFPYSDIDEYRDFVGARNRAGRFPAFNAIDFQATKQFTIKLMGKERRVRAGIRLFNILNNFNPQDVQENLSSPFYGTFYRGVKRKIRGVFEIGN